MAGYRLTWRGAGIATLYTGIGMAGAALFLGILREGAAWMAAPRQTPPIAATK